MVTSEEAVNATHTHNDDDDDDADESRQVFRGQGGASFHPNWFCRCDFQLLTRCGKSEDYPIVAWVSSR